MMFPKKKVIKDKKYLKQYDLEHPWDEWLLATEGIRVPGWLGAHHVEFKSEGGSDVWENLIRLSKETHDKAHHDKKLWKKLFKGYKEYMEEVGKK